MNESHVKHEGTRAEKVILTYEGRKVRDTRGT